MSDTTPPHSPTILEQISTRWPLVSDPAKFFLRYAPAIQRYLTAILRDSHAVDEVTQDLLLHVVEKRFAPEQVTRGRFRDYLKAVVRNAAYSHLRKQQSHAEQGVEVELLAAPGDHPSAAAEKEWDSRWKICLLERVWDNLDRHERENPASRCFSVMKITVDHPTLDSTQQAAMLSAQVGEAIRADAFRKQLSRARRLFARFVVREVATTLEEPTAAMIEEELSDLQLLDEVAPLLPPDWREQKDLLNL